jgi:phage terminase Nu1 subunit (DNA packaging protein)
MKDEEKKVVTPTTEPTATPVVTETKVETKKVETKAEDGGNEDVETEKVNYVKYRVDRAKEQVTKELFKDLGVKDIDEAKNLISNGTKALEEVNKLQAKLEAQEKETANNQKITLLTKVLDKENVFDSDALINYIDLEKVEIENGQIKDSENIIANLKKAKPNFFGKYQVVGDNYKKGENTIPSTAEDKRKNGDNVGAISDYLKAFKK